jgi:hypothetical protein
MRLSSNPVFDITSGPAVGRRIRGAFVICAAASAITIMLARWPAASLGAAEPSQSAQPQDQAVESAEHARVEGFRSARWGMTEAQVKAVILKDFSIAADKVQAEENSSERTTVLSINVNELLEGAGKARISYIFGYSSKKLIQVNIVWGTSIDPQAQPERVVAAANQLRALFLSAGYDPATTASNVATGQGAITVFQGQDSEKHTTLLRLVSSPAPPPAKQRGKNDKHESVGPHVALLLSYVQDARNPDIYRLKKGQF